MAEDTPHTAYSKSATEDDTCTEQTKQRRRSRTKRTRTPCDDANSAVRAIAGISRLSGERLQSGAHLPKGSFVEVEWLDNNPELEEQELLLQKTTIGRLAELTSKILCLATSSNSLDGNEVLLIDTERVLRVLSITIPKRQRV